MTVYQKALDRFLAEDRDQRGWRALDFFSQGNASAVLDRVSARAAAGAHVLPTPEDIFAALRLTRCDQVRVVILGQDPYPTPGDAHGLAFSYRGNRRLPASLRNIFRELGDDLATAARKSGDLSDWAEQGVLLLNTALTVEAGQAGSHLQFGWQALADQIMRRLAERSAPCAFILWGDRARQYAPLINPQRHLLIESPHPSPLSAYRGFFGSRPFSRVNTYLAAQQQITIQWDQALSQTDAAHHIISASHTKKKS